MPGILSRFTRPKLSVADRHRLLLQAVDLHEAMTPPAQVAAALQAAGASPDDARDLTAEALRRYEADLVRRVALPKSARSEVNFYFLLGVTPVATQEEIRRGYRRKARQVHPDQHNQDFGQSQWTRLMQFVTEASAVLGEPETRRAYDVIWRERSRETAIANRRKGEQRGDWETRYRWTIAEMSQDEDQIAEVLEDLRAALAKGELPEGLPGRLDAAVRGYEDAILQVRTETYSLPATFESFGDEVRREMQRKEKLVPPLQRLAEHVHAGVNATVEAEVAACAEALTTVQYHQHLFDIRSAGFR
ncbi:MAG TPA: J domain-containing protein [Candidatus Dormibacteraeota bacterium]|jgi:hypothetical protein|nr:J domain-containing protein [Candidatus Dormibacteraeota bacterium]